MLDCYHHNSPSNIRLLEIIESSEDVHYSIEHFLSNFPVVLLVEQLTRCIEKGEKKGVTSTLAYEMRMDGITIVKFFSVLSIFFLSALKKFTLSRFLSLTAVLLSFCAKTTY